MGEQTVGEMMGRRIRVHDAALTDVQVAHGPVRIPCPHMSCTSSEPLVYKVLKISGNSFASAGSSAGDNRTLMEVLVVALQAPALASYRWRIFFRPQALARHAQATSLAAQRIANHMARLFLVKIGVIGKGMCHARVGGHRRKQVGNPMVINPRRVVASSLVEELVVGGGFPFVARPSGTAMHRAACRRERRPRRVGRSLEGVTQA